MQWTVQERYRCGSSGTNRAHGIVVPGSRHRRCVHSELTKQSGLALFHSLDLLPFPYPNSLAPSRRKNCWPAHLSSGRVKRSPAVAIAQSRGLHLPRGRASAKARRRPALFFFAAAFVFEQRASCCFQECTRRGGGEERDNDDSMGGRSKQQQQRRALERKKERSGETIAGEVRRRRKKDEEGSRREERIRATLRRQGVIFGGRDAAVLTQPPSVAQRQQGHRSFGRQRRRRLRSCSLLFLLYPLALPRHSLSLSLGAATPPSLSPRTRGFSPLTRGGGGAALERMPTSFSSVSWPGSRYRWRLLALGFRRHPNPPLYRLRSSFPFLP